MRIGINGYEAVVPRFGFNKDGFPNRVGSAEVCYQLLVELAKIDKENVYIIYLPSAPTPDMPKESENWHYKVVRGRRLWTLFSLNKAVNSDHLDLFFNPTHYSPLMINCPQVIAVLDVSYKYFPELFKKKDLFKLRWWGGYSIKKARKVITISQSSKDDIMKEYGISERKISVINVGVKTLQASKMTKEELFTKYNLSYPYILFVGTLQPRKNITRLIEAYSQIASNGNRINSNEELVIIGRRGWQFDEILSAPEKYGVTRKVHFLEDVTDDDLPLFYKHAEVFVLPSLYEGFGLPVLEAMKYGCPVITSSVSSLPEAGGDAALYVDPKSVEDIASKIKKVLADKELREKMIKKGNAQVKKFSWEKAAREVISVFEETSKAVSSIMY